MLARVGIHVVFSRYVAGTSILLLGICLLQTAEVVKAQSNLPKVFNVRANDSSGHILRDDQAEIDSAVAQALAWTNANNKNQAIIKFSRGVYDLSQIRNLYAIDIQHAHDITFEGQACSFTDLQLCTTLIGAPATLLPGPLNVHFNTFFSVGLSQHISIRNFVLDKKIPYFSQGTIQHVEIAKRSVTLQPDPGYLDLDGLLAQRLMNIIMFFPLPTAATWDHSHAACAPEQSSNASSDPNGCSNFHILARHKNINGSWTFVLDKSPLVSFTNGKYLIWKNLGWQYGILIDRSEDVSIENVFYTGGGGPAAHIQRPRGMISIKNLVVDVPPGSGRLFSATSGVNGGHGRGQVVLDHLVVRHSDDDGFHFSAGSYFPAISQSKNGTTVNVGGCYDSDFEKGDHIAAWDWKAKRELSRAVVESETEGPTSIPGFPRICELRLNTALPALSGMKTFNSSKLGQAQDSNDRIINLSLNEHLLVENSVLSSMRARCGIIQVEAIYRNNLCENTPGGGLIVGPEFQWGEGYAVQSAVITGNTFRAIGGTAIRIGDIFDSTRSQSRTQIQQDQNHAVEASVNRNIVIQNNRFEDLGSYQAGFAGTSGVAISVQNADGVTIDHNSYTAPATAVVISQFTAKNILRSETSSR